MKTPFTAFFVLIFAESLCQASIKGDTLYYQQIKYFKGKEVQLAQGTGQSKEFVFAFLSTGMMNINAPATLAKSTVIINQVKVNQVGKPYVVAMLGKKKVLIDIEGAVNNGEIAKE